MNQEISDKLYYILTAEINKFLIENEAILNGSGLEILIAILNVACNLVADSDCDPKLLVDFINETFEQNVLETRKLYQNNN